MMNQSMNSLKLEMERKMKTSLGVVLPVAAGVLGAILLAVPSALAQTTVSTFTIQVSGSASAAKTGLGEAVTFSGPLVVTATVVTDPSASTPSAATSTLPPSVVVAIDGRGVIGTGQKSGTKYVNECEANLTRFFAATDSVELTFAFFPAPSASAASAGLVGSYLSSKTGVVRLNLAYDTATTALTNVTAAFGTL
jgi:hypothetical protein